MPNDLPVPLQQDNVTNVPGTGAGIRTVLVTVLVNNVPTVVAMQAITIADADGRTLDFRQPDMMDVLQDILHESRITNEMLSALTGLPYIPPVDPNKKQSRVYG